MNDCNVNTQRKEAIILAAEEIMLKNGVSKTSVSDISKCCSLGPGQIYRCFENKETIVASVLSRILKKKLDALSYEHDISLTLIVKRLVNETSFFSCEERYLILECLACSVRDDGLNMIINRNINDFYAMLWENLRRKNLEVNINNFEIIKIIYLLF